MEYRDLRRIFALFLLFLSPLAIAGSPEVADAVELTEEIAQSDTDPELLPTEGEIGEDILDEDENVQGVTIEEGTPFEVPALIDRPLAIEEGPYIVVKEFNMIDAEDYPEHKVSVSEIKSTILDDLLKKQPERGFSVGELQEVADEVTRYYRTKGLILSTAVVPVQTITDGVVDIQVFIGRLGRVVTEGNKKYDLETLKKPFSKLIGQPVTQHEIEEALLVLTDFAGLSVFGVFRPGIKVGEADIVLKVQQEKSYDVDYRIDTHGLKETGLNRFRTIVHWNNPTGGADKITVTVQQTYNPKMNNFWSIDYKVYLGQGYTFGTGIFRNFFRIGGDLAANKIAAETINRSFYLEKSFTRGRQRNFSSRLTLTQKKSRTQTQAIQTNIDRLTVLALAMNYDSVDSIHPLRPIYRALFKDTPEGYGGGLNFLNVTWSRGFNNVLGAMGSSGDQFAVGTVAANRSGRRGNSAVEVAEGQFEKVTLSYQRLQLLAKSQSLMFGAEAQWSNDVLSNQELYSIGGAENVRGFPDAQGLFDRAFFFKLEYILNAPFGLASQPAFMNRTWGEVLQLSFFYDVATATNNDPLSNTDPNQQNRWSVFRSIGLGLRFNIPGSINSRLMYANKIGVDIPNDNRYGRLWADFTYSF
jgi:hemolysin activation/secretion protein